MLSASDLGGFSEAAIDALRNKLVIHIADGWARSKTCGRIALAALRRNPKLLHAALFALQFGRPMDEFLGFTRGVHDRLQVAVLLDPEAGDGFACLGNAVNDPLRPAGLDADHDARRNVWIGASADEGTEMQIEISAKLQAAVGVR